jgi:hypothetical protein
MEGRSRSRTTKPEAEAEEVTAESVLGADHPYVQALEQGYYGVPQGEAVAATTEEGE